MSKDLSHRVEAVQDLVDTLAVLLEDRSAAARLPADLTVRAALVLAHVQATLAALVTEIEAAVTAATIAAHRGAAPCPARKVRRLVAREVREDD